MNAIGTLPLIAALVAAPAASWAAAQPPEATEPSQENDRPSAAAEPPSESDARPATATELQNPVPYTRTSIQRGRVLYAGHCPICHGADGKALIELISNATDLTAPARWRYGTSDAEIFKSIRDGAGVDMPPYATSIKNENDLWHLVNFIRSLWPQSMRPELVPEEGVATGSESQAPAAAQGETPSTAVP